MKINYYLADQNPHRDRSLGISNYTLGLLDAVKDCREVYTSTVESRSSISYPSTNERLIIPWRTDRFLRRLLADHLHPLFNRGARENVIHYPKGFLPLIIGSRSRVVATVHDTILDHYITHYPAERSAAAWKYWAFMLKHTLKRSDAIITVSDTAKNQIIAYAKKNGIVLPPIYVTYEGSVMEKRVQIGGERLVKEDYLLAFVSTQPHKKTMMLLEMWENWKNQSKENTKLRLVGQVTFDTAELIKKNPSIELLPHQSIENLVRIIQMARGTIVPSEIEGFGLPVLESYYLGTPAIVAQNTSCHEILDFNPKAAFLPGNQASFNEAMSWILNMPSEQVSEIQQAFLKKYSWAKVAEETFRVYERVLSTR